MAMRRRDITRRQLRDLLAMTADRVPAVTPADIPEHAYIGRTNTTRLREIAAHHGVDLWQAPDFEVYPPDSI